jgi:hypothetical protein
MALRIEYEPLDALEPYARNPRTHSAAQLKLIERSLARFGWATPVGKADGVLIYGHARRQAALNLRARGVRIPHHPDPNVAPVVDLSHLSKADRRAYVIADNQLAVLAGWDDDLLRLELTELRDEGFDLALTGFSDPEIADLLEIEPVGEDAPGSLLELIDVTIAEPKHAVAKGDHWVLAGRHHLFCASVIEGWPVWRPYLKKGCLFCPYPGPFVPFGKRAAEASLVMVQPDSYTAGHLLDHYAAVRGESALTKAENENTLPPS